MIDEREMIESDFDDISESEILVILIIDGATPILKTRLQKTSLLYHEIYESDKDTTDHNAYLFGGYSDDIDESAVNLTDMGILEDTKSGYVLTDYGKKLRQYVLDEYEDVEKIEAIDNLKKAVASIPDKYLVGLTYHFYNETTVNSTILASVKKLNETASYDGIPLCEYAKEDFEEKLRKGIPLRRSN